MSAARDCELIGRWRSAEADLWDRDYLDLVEPAYIAFARNGPRRVRLWRPQRHHGTRIRPIQRVLQLAGFDEGDEISGSGSAKLGEEGTIEIELSFRNGDDAILNARRE